MQSKRRVQFQVRSLLVAVSVAAVCVANRQSLLEFSCRYFYPVALSLVVASWWFAQLFRKSNQDTSPRSGFSIGCIGVLIAATACFLSVWVRHRWVVSFHEDAYPQSFPYPDAILLAFHDWFDSQYPAEPGHFKLHGEFYTVLLCLNLTAFGFTVVLGTMIGFVFRPNGPIGITYWRDKTAALCRKATSTNREDM
jgi:hypothetical protein